MCGIPLGHVDAATGRHSSHRNELTRYDFTSFFVNQLLSKGFLKTCQNAEGKGTIRQFHHFFTHGFPWDMLMLLLGDIVVIGMN